MGILNKAIEDVMKHIGDCEEIAYICFNAMNNEVGIVIENKETGYLSIEEICIEEEKIKYSGASNISVMYSILAKRGNIGCKVLKKLRDNSRDNTVGEYEESVTRHLDALNINEESLLCTEYEYKDICYDGNIREDIEDKILRTARKSNKNVKTRIRMAYIANELVLKGNRVHSLVVSEDDIYAWHTSNGGTFLIEGGTLGDGIVQVQGINTTFPHRGYWIRSSILRSNGSGIIKCLGKLEREIYKNSIEGIRHLRECREKRESLRVIKGKDIVKYFRGS